MAFVAGNDYASNLRGFGIARCLKEIQKINENGSCTTEALVHNFEQMHDRKGHFQIASAVFLNHHETSCAICVERFQEQIYKDCCSQLQRLKEEYRAVRTAKCQTTQGRSLQELKLLKFPSRKNAFSPVVHTQLGRYKVKEIAKIKLTQFDVTPAETIAGSASVKSSTRKKSNRRQGKKKKKARYLKSAKQTRTTPSLNPHGKHKLAPTTVDMCTIKNKYQIKSWQLGTLRSQIQKSSLDTEIQKVVIIRIQNAVKLVNRAAQAALLIVELFLHDVQNNLLIENELLFGVNGGEKVWSNLLSYLLLPEKRGKKGPRLFQIIKKFIEDFKLGLGLSEEELE